MPPKKRDKDGEVTKHPRLDQMQAEHELFLQAFDKPTQIYRYIRTRSLCSPIYLNRTLTYMKHRMSRSNKSRVNFKVNNILERITSHQQPSLVIPGYLNITFLGYYDKSADSTGIAVIDTHLITMSHKKRKDSFTQKTHQLLGTSEVLINPPVNNSPLLVPSVYVAPDLFTLSRGPLVKSFSLSLKARCLYSSGDSTTDEPSAKRRKSVHNLNSRIIEDPNLYSIELVLYDKQSRCALTNGDYDLRLDVTASTKTSPKKHITWENAFDLGDNYQFEHIDLPLIKFRLTWSKEPLKRFVERPVPYIIGEDKSIGAVANTKGKEEKSKVVYHFIYNNNTRQPTEANDDLECPWCALQCKVLYTLLKHLKLCHSRFTFTYVPISFGARIDVAINELYDGSYTGSPHDLIIQPTMRAFSRNGPMRRTPVTQILVCHPKRTLKPSLSEFLEQEDCDYDGQRPFITGHNRLYHHTTTCLPIYPKEMDVDSEGDNDPEWLQTKTRMMIDEFTDVNDGEKELMKMWNLHVMKCGFVGDCQIAHACSTFVQFKGEELLKKNLYRNFGLHLCSLFDFSLLNGVGLYQTMQRLQQMIEGSSDLCTALQKSREAQLNTSKSYDTINQTKETHETCKVSGTRKAATVGLQRRKGTPAISTRRKSLAADVQKKRLSLSLTKSEQRASGS